MKSVTILKNVVQLLHLGHLDTSKSIFKNFCHSRLEQSWKKCSLAGSKGASHYEMARKLDSLNLLNCHLATSWN